MSAQPLVDQSQVDRVWAEWVGRQAKPERCKLTPVRRQLIVRAMKQGYSAENLISLVTYAYEADEAGPRWWRGENPSGALYLALENLLVVSKLAPRVEAAQAWEDGDEEEDTDEAEPAPSNVVQLLRGGGSTGGGLRRAR